MEGTGRTGIVLTGSRESGETGDTCRDVGVGGHLCGVSLY